MIAVDKILLKMPQGQYRRPRLNFGISEESKDKLEQWAKDEHRTISNLVEAITEEALKTRQITNPAPITTDDLDQIKKFIALLMGERDRNGVSFTLLGQTLEVAPDQLLNLYELVKDCREHQGRIKR